MHHCTLTRWSPGPEEVWLQSGLREAVEATARACCRAAANGCKSIDRASGPVLSDEASRYIEENLVRTTSTSPLQRIEIAITVLVITLNHHSR
mmetsp:Transcript_62402/g.123312  ORF Transcript_62402/g.123312 Transcript_62402/m.123312 type:complete len:93 (-) Transcript_62402:168-446(-)